MSIAFDNHRPSRADIEPVALDLIQRRGAEILATARHYAVSAEDAEDAYQRALEILLTKAPSVDEAELVPWLKVVVKHEAWALRRARARDVPAEHGALDSLPGDSGDAEECVERLDRLRVGAEALQRLKPHETRCMVLLAQGYSYSQIQELTGFSYTKVNRCLSEGRRAFFDRVRGIESGEECERMAPLLSALADGEATAADTAALRPHLRGCAACRATLRDYRAAPRELAAVLGPLGIVAAETGEVASSGVSTLSAWLGNAALKLQSLFEVAGAQKAAVVAASTVAIAGAGAATMHEMQQPSPAKAQSAAKPHPAAAAQPRPTAQAAAVTRTASATQRTSSQTASHTKKRTKRQSTPPAVVQPVVASRLAQQQPPTRQPAAQPPTPDPKPDPPADPGGEFGP